MPYKIIIRFLAGWIVRFLFRVEIVGRGQVPAAGGVIVCANHIHLFDPVLIALAVERPIRFMAKAEIFSWPFLGFLAKKAGAFPVKRGSADIQAIKRSLTILSGGEVLGIFPEGTRSKTLEMSAPTNGVILLAERTKVPIVPAAIWGEYRLGKRVRVVIGEAVELSSLSPEPYSRARAAENLMAHIKKLRDSLQ